MRGFDPVGILRYDDASLERALRSGGEARLGAWLLTIGVGGAAYGFAFGAWRSLEQGVYSAIKLPLLLLLVLASSALLNGAFAAILRTDFDLRASFRSMVFAFSSAAALLLAFSPVALFLMWSLPGPNAAGAEGTARTLLVAHVLVIGLAATLGNMRLYRAIRLELGERQSRRLLGVWLVVQAFVGTQLSWILRPFLCKPGLEPEFLRGDAFASNFYEEMLRLALGAGGEVSMVQVFVVFAIVATVGFGLWLRAERRVVQARLARDGGFLSFPEGEVFFSFAQLDAVLPLDRRGSAWLIPVDLRDPVGTGRGRRFLFRYADEEAARSAYDVLQAGWARSKFPSVPYRTELTSDR